MENKKQKCTRKKTKFIGNRNLIDQQTGEVITVQEVSIEERDANFHKIWMSHVIQALDLIGNQKIKILNILLENANKENLVIMTQRKISDISKVSYKTVAITMKMLQDSDFIIKKQSGVYFINPEMIFKGGSGERMRILFDYKNIKNE
jgi:DNA-binding transcriptional regulator YhcF (GntR family)